MAHTVVAPPSTAVPSDFACNASNLNSAGAVLEKASKLTTEAPSAVVATEPAEHSHSAAPVDGKSILQPVHSDGGIVDEVGFGVSQVDGDGGGDEQLAATSTRASSCSASAAISHTSTVSSTGAASALALGDPGQARAAQYQTGAASALALGGRPALRGILKHPPSSSSKSAELATIHNPSSRLQPPTPHSSPVGAKRKSPSQPPDPMPPELMAAGFPAADWANPSRFGKPARKIVRAAFKHAKSAGEVQFAVRKAFDLLHQPPPQLTTVPRGPVVPNPYSATFGDARLVSVHVAREPSESGGGDPRSGCTFTLRLGANCVELYAEASRALHTTAHAICLLHSHIGCGARWRPLVQDAELSAALTSAMQQQPPYLFLRVHMMHERGPAGREMRFRQKFGFRAESAGYTIGGGGGGLSLRREGADLPAHLQELDERGAPAADPQVWHRTPAQELKEAERHALLAAQRAGLLHGRASYLLETTGLSGLLAATTDILSGRAVSPCGAPGGQR